MQGEAFILKHIWVLLVMWVYLQSYTKYQYLLLTESFLSFTGFHLRELFKYWFLFSERCEGIAS